MEPTAVGWLPLQFSVNPNFPPVSAAVGLPVWPAARTIHLGMLARPQGALPALALRRVWVAERRVPNPNGIAASSPGLRGTSYPGNRCHRLQPQRGCGHGNDFGVLGNQASQWEFFRQITGLLFKWLHRRRQRTSYTWAGLADLFTQYAVPKPCVTEKPNG